jgi:pyruvate ferredoxin oxidoreductase delta subunit
VSWDISDIASWTAKDYPLGAAIPTAGNSDDYVTGGWRSDRPVFDAEKCTQCMLCFIYCPDASVALEGNDVTGFDYDHCKGCGICATECPSDAIEMVPEGCELPEVG